MAYSPDQVVKIFSPIFQCGLSYQIYFFQDEIINQNVFNHADILFGSLVFFCLPDWYFQTDITQIKYEDFLLPLIQKNLHL